MSGFVCGLDVHKSCCDVMLVGWFGNVVDYRKVYKDVAFPLLFSRIVLQLRISDV